MQHTHNIELSLERFAYNSSIRAFQIPEEHIKCRIPPLTSFVRDEMLQFLHFNSQNTLSDNYTLAYLLLAATKYFFQFQIAAGDQLHAPGGAGLDLRGREEGLPW